MLRQGFTVASSPQHEGTPKPINRERRAALGAGFALILGMVLGLLRAGAQGKLRSGNIGSGNIGGTVGTLWVKAGHPVLFSSRQQ